MMLKGLFGRKAIKQNEESDTIGQGESIADSNGIIDVEKLNHDEHVQDAYAAVVLSATPPAPRTEVRMVRRNGTPPPMEYYGITSIDSYSTDVDTIIIRYDDPLMLSTIQSLVRSKAHKDAESFINQFINVDIFVNLSLNPHVVDPDKYRGKRWLRVAYELMEGNTTLSAIKRFPQAIVVHVGRTLNKPELSLDMLLEGGR